MKSKGLIFVLLLTFTVVTAAQESGLGSGVIIGEPTGISAKYWLNGKNAFDIAVAYSFFGANNGLFLKADYLFHLARVNFSNQTFLPFYGFGGKIKFAGKGNNSVGARGVIGVALLLKKAPVDIFIEIAPTFDLLPATGISIGAALGARYYFVIN